NLPGVVSQFHDPRGQLPYEVGHGLEGIGAIEGKLEHRRRCEREHHLRRRCAHHRRVSSSWCNARRDDRSQWKRRREGTWSEPAHIEYGFLLERRRNRERCA